MGVLNCRSSHIGSDAYQPNLKFKHLLTLHNSDVKRIKMLKENCRESGSSSSANNANKYKTSSPSSGRYINNNNGKNNDSGVNQFQELNNYRMTNWKNLVRLRENSRSTR